MAERLKFVWDCNKAALCTVYTTAVCSQLSTPQCVHHSNVHTIVYTTVCTVHTIVYTTVCTQCSQEVDRCVGGFFKLGRYCHICGCRSSLWIGLLTPLPIRRGTALV